MFESFEEESAEKSKSKSTIDSLILENLIGSIVEGLHESSKEIEDPFERYTYELRERFHHDMEVFSNRFIEGYEVLLRQLNSR